MSSYLSGAGGRLQTGRPGRRGWADLIGGLVDAFHFVCCGFTGVRGSTDGREGWLDSRSGMRTIRLHRGLSECCVKIVHVVTIRRVDRLHGCLLAVARHKI